MATWHMLSHGTRGCFIFFLSRHLSFSSSPPRLPFFLPPSVSMGGAERGPLVFCPCFSLLSRVLVSFSFLEALLFYLFSSFLM